MRSNVPQSARLAIALTLAVVLSVPRNAQADLTTDRSTLVPTAKAFGRPVNNFPPPVMKTGILDCDSSKTTCTVRNMPLLTQTDPGVDRDVADMAGVGCYDTSILTVMLTALANHASTLTPGGRAKSLLAVPAGNASKEIEQLSQEYRWAKQGQHHVKVNGKVVQPLYLHEVVADFGTIQESCDPFTYGNCGQASNNAGRAFRTFVSDESVTNESVRNLMKRGYVALIAYARYTPIPGSDGTVTFRRDSQHKVVFSGYQPGKYPLLINDVGNGQRYHVRLATDLSQRKLSAPGTSFKYPGNTKTYLEYEDTGAGIDDQVFFIEHIDALRLLTADALLIEKTAAHDLIPLGCFQFPGRIGDYACKTDVGIAKCEEFRGQEKAQVCRDAKSN